MRTHWCGGLLLPAIMLALTACGPVDFTRRAGAPAEVRHVEPAKRPASSESPAPSPPERTATLRPAIHRQLETESYRSALNLLCKEIKRGLPEAAMAEEYGQAINGILAKAELYRKQGLPDKAGELFRCAHDRFPKTEAVARKVRLTPSEIFAGIEDCAGQLMERGLASYRAGDLDEAIRTWKMIQAFSPRHQASRKALETAEVQRANLEKVSTKN